MQSKLPNTTLSIFALMSKMATQYNALNLSQGFPDFNTDPVLIDLVTKAMHDGYNQYAPLAGDLRLRENISAMISHLHGKTYDPQNEITITAGASEALYASITAFINPGDEVIILKPAYDTYEPTIRLQGGIPVLIQLQAPYTSIDWDEVRSKISSKTRMLIINNPHNPSGNVFSHEDLSKLEELLAGTNILLLSDEVYEHIVFDDRKHLSVAAYDKLAQQSIITASFGKTFHTTGWKVGYCLAPDNLMREIHKVHQNVIFCVSHPLQKALATYLEEPKRYLGLSKFYEQKRDLFLKGIEGSRFTCKPAMGTYFQMLDYSAISQENARLYAERLIKENGIASIPVSVFNCDEQDHKFLRFCFAKSDETLEKAAAILRSI